MTPLGSTLSVIWPHLLGSQALPQAESVRRIGHVIDLLITPPRFYFPYSSHHAGMNLLTTLMKGFLNT